MAFLRDIFNMNESKNAHERMYGGGDNFNDNYEGYQDDQPERRHQSSWTHEMVAGAAGFAGKTNFRFDFHFK
jgi:hypothetical protein